MKTPYPDRCDLAAAAIILLATSVFVICARGELWFDEVLSLQWAKNASTPWQLLTDYRHDNNHLLNSSNNNRNLNSNNNNKGYNT